MALVDNVEPLYLSFKTFYDSAVITQVNIVLTILTYDKLSVQSFSQQSYTRG